MTKKLSFALACALVSPVWGHSGHISENGWDFDWEVKDSAGLAIRNVRFQNQYYIYKASMPVIKVHYETVGNPPHTCGPYHDQIDWANLQDISWCNNSKLCHQTFNQNGHNWTKVAILA